MLGSVSSSSQDFTELSFLQTVLAIGDSVDRGAWQAIFHKVAELDLTEQLTFSLLLSE